MVVRPIALVHLCYFEKCPKIEVKVEVVSSTYSKTRNLAQCRWNHQFLAEVGNGMSLDELLQIVKNSQTRFLHARLSY